MGQERSSYLYREGGGGYFQSADSSSRNFQGGQGRQEWEPFQGQRQEQGQRKGQEGKEHRQEQERQAVADPANSGTSEASAQPDPGQFCPILDSGGLIFKTAPWANIKLEDFGSVLLAAINKQPGTLHLKAAPVGATPHPGMSGASSRLDRELLPMPLPSNSAEEYFETDRCRLKQEFKNRMGLRSWIVAVLILLNASVKAISHSEQRKPKNPTMAQRHAFCHICEYALYFCDLEGEVPIRNWSEFLASRSVSYTGEDHLKAQRLTWLQIQPGLPPPKHCASIDVLDLCEGSLLDYFKNPEEALIHTLPNEAPRAGSVMATPDEAILIAKNLLDLGLVRILSENELVVVGGRPLLNGLFGVSKGKPVPGNEHLTVLRLIMNLTASNSVMEDLRGDIGALPYFGQWKAIILNDNENLLWSYEDMIGCFHLFRLPDSWSRYFAFNCAFKASDLGLEGDKSVYIGSRVMPMGWCNSMGIVQYLHRRLLTKATGSPQSLPMKREVRKDKPFPVFNSSSADLSAFWQTYCDDFDLPELVRESPEFYKQLEGLHEWHELARDLYRAGNVPTSAEKAGVRKSRVTRLGALIDGVAGRISPSGERFGMLIGLTGYVLSLPRVNKHTLQVLCGHWTNAFQFRREASSYLSKVWSLISKMSNWSYFILPLSVRREFISCLALLPLLQFNLRAALDPMVTVSDASETGGGACASISLTQEGIQAFTREINRIPAAGRDEVGLISLFDGIGGARQAFNLLGLEVAAFASSEVCPHACRVVRSAWPDVQEWGDIRDVDKSTVLSFLRSALHLKIIFIIAGSPCQDVSGLNAQGAGLKGSRSSLLFEAIRVIDLVKSVARGIEVCVLVENVKSMDSHGPESRRAFSKLLNLLPFTTCPSSFTDTRRPRYYWLSWTLWSNSTALIYEEDERSILKLVGNQPSWACQFEKGARRLEGCTTPFATFVQAIKRKRPPIRPAGLEGCSEAALTRWAADEYRYPPYQYEDRNGVFQNGVWRPLNSRERSVRLGFPWNHCETAVTKSRRHSDPRGTEDICCSLLGNSFSCPVIAWMIGQKLFSFGIIPKLPSPNDCWGSTESISLNLDSNPGDTPEMAAVRLLHRNVMYRGSDVRLASQTLLSPSAWPRKPMDLSRWNWKVVLSFPLGGQHINVLELQAIVSTLKWRLRKCLSFGKRFTHAVDSQVCLAVCAKGRSSSRILCRVLHKLNTLILASSTQTVYMYVRSADNPADRPSRWVRPIGHFPNG